MAAVVFVVVFVVVFALAGLGPTSVSQAAGKRLEGVVNVNTASVDLLVLLPGLGPAKVEALLLYRRKHPFRTVEELGRVKGIGVRMVRELRPHLAVAGPSTATLTHVKTDWEALRRLAEGETAPAAGKPITGAAAGASTVGKEPSAPAKPASTIGGKAPSATGSSVVARTAPGANAARPARARPVVPRWRRPAVVPCLGPA